VASFTHHVETLLEKLRTDEVPPSPKLAEILLTSKDQIKALLAADQGQGEVGAGSSENRSSMQVAHACKQNTLESVHDGANG